MEIKLHLFIIGYSESSSSSSSFESFHSIWVSKSITIGELKKKISSEIENAGTFEISLIYNGDEMKDYASLSEYNIKKTQNLNLLFYQHNINNLCIYEKILSDQSFCAVVKPIDTIDIHITTSLNDVKTLKVEPNITISSLKEIICQTSGISAKNQRLFFNGIELNRLYLLISDENIKNGAIIHMLCSLKEKD